MIVWPNLLGDIFVPAMQHRVRDTSTGSMSKQCLTCTMELLIGRSTVLTLCILSCCVAMSESLSPFELKIAVSTHQADQLLKL